MKDDGFFYALKDVIGLELAVQFCCRWGGDSVYIPTRDYIERKQRQKAVIDDYTSGNETDPGWLSEDHDLSASQVRRILKRYLGQTLVEP